MLADRLTRLLIEPRAEVLGAEARQQAQFLAFFYVVLIPLSIAMIGIQTWLRPEWRTAALVMSPGLVVMFATYGLARTRHYRLATWITLALATAMTVIAIAFDPANPSPYAYLLVPAMLASVTLRLGQATAVAVSNLAIGLVAAFVDDALLAGHKITVFAMLLVMTSVVLAAARHRRTLEGHRRAQLEARDKRQSALLEAGFGGMALVRHGEVVECSRGFAATLGYAPEDVIGHQIQRYLAPHEGPMSGEREALHRDGTIFPVEVVALAYEELGEQGAAVAIRDLTEHRRLRAQLHQADRMATMGQLAAGVAHEINNPLAWVLGNLDLLVEELEGKPRDNAIRAVEGARRVERIVRDLKTFSRTREPEGTSVDLRRAVESAVNMIRHQLRDRGGLVEDYADCPPIDGDETRVGQVCLNLLVNAIEALPEGQRDRNLIEVRVYTDAHGEAVVEVADNGPGIPPRIRHRMFEPFFTTKSQGTGLGLSITRSIVASLGGRLQVDSRVGVGTIMRVVLPPGLLAHDSAETATPPTPPPRASNRPSDHSVLVVDDELDILDLIASVLGEHQVTTAASAAEALALLEQDASYDVILCDLMMPEVTGMDLYGQAVDRWPHLADRFAFVTGGAYTHTARTFLDTTDAPVLHKPFSLANLRALVDELLSEAVTESEIQPR